MIVLLEIMSINILIISNSLNFYYKIARVKQQVQYFSRLSRSLGVKQSLIMKLFCNYRSGKCRAVPL